MTEPSKGGGGDRKSEALRVALPRPKKNVVWTRMYLTFWELSSFDQDRVDGKEGRDEEVVTKGPLSV